ncbi:hypothetical protein QBC47DRAFT_463544 [Echria macrotheca]|uniref:Methyltransferase domain-containing protein n=1 Tax=Echria macrotheca TaxID=438768 RepID=A0AAJ0B6P6_9PEZI|nr:hypothetical protein QBC47DRAFT_463544 [Echria macrotheca]
MSSATRNKMNSPEGLESLHKMFKNAAVVAGGDWEKIMLDSAKRVSAPIAIRMLDHVGLNKDTSAPFKLIDCACGTGVVAWELQRIIQPDVLRQSSILACDFSEQMVGVTQRTIAREGLVNTEVKQIDAQKTGLDSDSFTHYTMNIGFHVVPNSEAALDEAIRIVKPGGRIGLTTWHRVLSWAPDIEAAFKSFDFEAPFETALQTSTWGDWGDANWVRKTLEQKGLLDVKVEVMAYLQHIDSAEYFVKHFGMIFKWLMGSCWSEELRKEHPEEEVIQRVKEFLEKKYEECISRGSEQASLATAGPSQQRRSRADTQSPATQLLIAATYETSGVVAPPRALAPASSTPAHHPTMADSLGLPPNQYATLLNAINTIDQRLSRIEAAIRLGGINGAPSGPVAVPQPPPAPAPLTLTPAANPAAMMAPVAFRALEPPPEGYTLSSRSTMQDELDQWTIPRGYSMRIAGAKVSGKRKVRWVCFRGGEARHHRAPVDESVILQAKAEGRRKPTTDRTSKKCGCLFKFEVIETAKGSDLWVLHYPNEEHKVHNHGPSDQTSDPRARKLPSFMLAEVDQWLREGWLVSKIQDELKSRGFTNVLNTDLYNRKRQLRKEDAQMQE